MSLRKTIENIVKETGESTAQIDARLREMGISCSRRTIRRYANPIRKQLSGNVGDANLPKILLFDIETSPMEIYTWSLWQKYHDAENIIKDRAVLTWSAKWLFEAEVINAAVSAEEAMAREDSSILQGMWEMLDKADIVVAHNGDKFDHRILNTRFILNGMTPPMPYRTIDTLKAAKTTFAFSSNKLDYINKMLRLTPKRDTNFDLWKRCVTGDQSAIDEMVEYNKVDVVALEECYLEIRPWIRSHPPIALFIDTDEEICTNCGATDLSWGGHYYTPAGRYKAFRCESCGAIGRSRYSDLSKEERKKLFLSVAK